MRRVLLFAAVGALAASEARAQVDPDRVRFEVMFGVIQQGSIADASFQADFRAFTGPFVERDGGSLDVDPTVSMGVRGVYRIDERWSVRAAYMHAEGRLRVQFPAEASVAGNFDLEGLLLAGDDFQSGGQEGARAQQVMSDAYTDVFQVAGTYEFPLMNRWVFPYLTVGGGIFRQVSDGRVIRFQYEGDIPPGVQVLENSGSSTAEILGLSQFGIENTDPMVSWGAGFRVSAGKKWAVDFSFEDLMAVNRSAIFDDTCVGEFGEIIENCTQTPDADGSQNRLYSTTFAGNKGIIHNWSAVLSLSYAVWPYGLPR